jgi:L-threonylcarbamoyladenylate synthase
LAISRIYEVKARPGNHPLIVHISSWEQICIWAKDIPDYAKQLATSFWPGPMTLILPRTELAKNTITGGQENVAVRVPSNRIALQLLNEFKALGGQGVVAPSANRFGSVSPTTSRAVRVELGSQLSNSDLILEGESCEIGIESTIIDCTKEHPVILRPGAITSGMIQSALKSMSQVYLRKSIDTKVKSPGKFESHYVPKTKVILKGKPSKGDGFFALNSVPTPIGAVRVAAPINVEEFARILYESLRKADEMNLEKLFVELPVGDGLEVAIEDRLTKASFKGKF